MHGKVEMKAKEFKEILQGRIYSIDIVDSVYTDVTRQSGGDAYDRDDTSTSHSIEGFHAAPEKAGKYFDLTVPFEPEFGKTYYLLYAVYSTGDSFGHDAGHSIEYIGFYTEDELAVAKENQRKIEDHSRNNKDSYSIKLKTPNGGRTFDQHTPWIGYFEQLDYTSVESIQRLP